MTRPVHVDYPHEPGYLIDCPACEDGCYCSPGAAECVFEGRHTYQCETYRESPVLLAFMFAAMLLAIVTIVVLV